MVLRLEGSFVTGHWRFHLHCLGVFVFTLGVVLATGIFVVDTGTWRRRVPVEVAKPITVRNSVREGKLMSKSEIYAHSMGIGQSHIKTRNNSDILT
jgi:hypothetical protein